MQNQIILQHQGILNYIKPYLTSRSSLLNIYDRKGKTVDSFALLGECLDLQWSSEGDILAVLQAKSSTILLWDSRGQGFSSIDTGLKYMELMSWSQNNMVN